MLVEDACIFKPTIWTRACDADSQRYLIGLGIRAVTCDVSNASQSSQSSQSLPKPLKSTGEDDARSAGTNTNPILPSQETLHPPCVSPDSAVPHCVCTPLCLHNPCTGATNNPQPARHGISQKFPSNSPHHHWPSCPRHEQAHPVPQGLSVEPHGV